MKYKYKVGDIVEVVFIGKSYTSYDTKFKLLNFQNKDVNPVFHLKKGDKGKIWARTKHEDYEDNLYAIVLEDFSEILIGEAGIEQYPKE